MSVMNFQSTFRDVKPPDKGSFPLDHEGWLMLFTRHCRIGFLNQYNQVKLYHTVINTSKSGVP